MRKRDDDAMRDGDVAELLSAHATGGLAPAEVARVEAYLAQHPEARAELDEIARTLAAVRAAEPRPQGEPDWDAMAHDIQRDCAGEPPPPWWQLWRLWSRRPVVLAATGAVAIGLAFVAVSRGGDSTREDSTREDRTAAVDPRDDLTAPAGVPGETGASETRVDTAGDATNGAGESGAIADIADTDADERIAADAHPDLRAPVLGDLSSDELESLERALDEAAPDDAFVADLLAAGPTDPGFSDPADHRDLYSEAEEDEAAALDPFQAPDYVPIDQLADELPDAAIDAIDRFLAEVQAG